MIAAVTGPRKRPIRPDLAGARSLPRTGLTLNLRIASEASADNWTRITAMYKKAKLAHLKHKKRVERIRAKAKARKAKGASTQPRRAQPSVAT
jgi:hypothetical protein